ncbi:centrosomal protein of 19 kDa isoform X2 [Dicentrarchus labrax]|uniref:Centrosomal protein of 19 kDa n=1 Tax=Dicentrarchus labrax TaxID=13489 RepID=A0A8P4KGP1_DICLA|nr:centrosomal protein of 19 kDa isoform X2 [Dicentrarchus labrax]
MQLFFYLFGPWIIPLWRRGSGTTDPAPAYSIMLQMNDYSMAAERLKNHPRHRDYLEGVSQSQLEKLHIILRDHMQGFSLERSLASFNLDPDEDLNKLDDEELARKKGQMDELFEKNRRHKDDPDFVYDLEMDFSKTTQEKCSWDEESDDGF